jgi:hypothetical protein
MAATTTNVDLGNAKRSHVGEVHRWASDAGHSAPWRLSFGLAQFQLFDAAGVAPPPTLSAKHPIEPGASAAPDHPGGLLAGRDFSILGDLGPTSCLASRFFCRQTLHLSMRKFCSDNRSQVTVST